MNTLIPISRDGRIGQDPEGRLWIMQNRWGDGDPLEWVCSSSQRDLRGKKCDICGQEWEFSADAWLNSTTTGEPFRRPVHGSCLHRHNTLRAASEWYGLLCDSPLLFNEMREAPNQYWPKVDRYQEFPNWFEVDLVIDDAVEKMMDQQSGIPIRLSLLEGATLRLGSRKRVFVLELVFPDDQEPFTKDDYEDTYIAKTKSTVSLHNHALMLHAWPGNNDQERKDILEAFGTVVHRRFPTVATRK